MLLMENLQFPSDQANILPKLSGQEQVILVKYQLDWKEIVDFLQMANF